jgi:hypothetical protein
MIGQVSVFWENAGNSCRSKNKVGIFFEAGKRNQAIPLLWGLAGGMGGGQYIGDLIPCEVRMPSIELRKEQDMGGQWIDRNTNISERFWSLIRFLSLKKILHNFPTLQLP